MAKAASKPKRAAPKPKAKRTAKSKLRPNPHLPADLRAKAEAQLRDPMDTPERVYTDDQARPGTFIRVVSGPHKGRYGVFHSIGDEHAGWPVTAVIRTRDAEDEQLLVDYGDLRPDVPGRR